jgi:hypothetical protein
VFFSSKSAAIVSNNLGMLPSILDSGYDAIKFLLLSDHEGSKIVFVCYQTAVVKAERTRSQPPQVRTLEAKIPTMGGGR